MHEPEDIQKINAIRANIVKIRTEKKISVRQLAARADLETSVIQDFVKGRRDILTMNLIKIARGLGVDVSELTN